MNSGVTRSGEHWRLSRAGALAAVLAVLLMLSCSPGTTPSVSDHRRQTSPGGRVAWLSGNWYLNGVNYPWEDYGNDFGGSAWGAFGVHDPKTRARVDADFAEMERQGIRSARWWIFSDGHAGITWDSRGMPSGLDKYVFPDLDSALALAQQHHIYLDLVLTDFTLMFDAESVNGAQQGGRAAVIDSAEGQRALINNVFKPIFQRYGKNPQVLLYEVMNEPEWGIRDDGAVDDKISKPTSVANFRRFVRDVAAAVHGNTSSYVTVGSASKAWAHQWTGLGLDLYSIHFYDEGRRSLDSDLYDTDYAGLNLDAPVVVGEYRPGSKKASFKQYLDNWFARGYAGAWVWSFKGVDEFGKPDAGVMKDWNSAHASVTDIRSAVSPSQSPRS